MEHFSFTPHALPPLLTAAAAVSAGIFFRGREESSKLTLLFLALSCAVAGWLFSTGMMQMAATEAAAVSWARFGFIAIPLIPAAVHHFSLVLLNTDASRDSAIAAVWGVAGGFSLLIGLGGVFIEGATQRAWGYWPQLSPWTLPFVLFFVGTLAATLREYIRRGAGGDARMARQPARTLMIAVAVGSLGVVDFLPSFGLTVYPFGFLPVAAAVFLSTRTLWRYRFSNAPRQLHAEQVLESLQSAVLVLDLDGVIRGVNRAAVEMLAYRRSELLGRSMRSFVESPFNIGRASDTLMRGMAIRDRAMIWRRKSGDAIEVTVSASMLRNEERLPVGIVYEASDISDRKRAAQVEYQAYHDALTGLPNRILFRNRVNAAIEGAAATRFFPIVMCLDLDGFKLVNDSLGHTAGDALLQAVASRMRSCLREGDVIARQGGDEFAILVLTDDPGAWEAVAKKILSSLSGRYDVEGHEVFASCSMGVAIHPNHGDDAEELLRNADAAMYMAKELGKNSYQLSRPATGQRAIARLSLENRVRRAFENGEFHLHFQPLLDLSLGVIIGGEALLRWPGNESIADPAEVIRVLEETGEIVPVGEWALRTACREATSWSDGAGHLRHVAVNFSPRQLQQRNFLKMIEQALAATSLDPSRLVIEITESVAMQQGERMISLLNDLKEIGVGVAIDDFGTGYSSLSYLRRFPVDTIKIDRSFVREVGLEKSADAIVMAIIAMGKALGLRVVAEGVETDDQIYFLVRERCDAVQGFAVSAPIPAASFRQLLAAAHPAIDVLRRRFPVLPLHATADH